MLRLLCGKKFIKLPKGASVTSIMKIQFDKEKDSHSGRIDEETTKLTEPHASATTTLFSTKMTRLSMTKGYCTEKE